jgi:hypothetical protein
MSQNAIILLIYHRYKLLDFIYYFLTKYSYPYFYSKFSHNRKCRNQDLSLWQRQRDVNILQGREFTCLTSEKWSFRLTSK